MRQELDDSTGLFAQYIGIEKVKRYFCCCRINSGETKRMKTTSWSTPVVSVDFSIFKGFSTYKFSVIRRSFVYFNNGIFEIFEQL